MKREDIIIRINVIEKEAQAIFVKIRDRLNRRLVEKSDPMMDYEVDVVVVAKSAGNSILYRSVSNYELFDKKELNEEYLSLNHNDFQSGAAMESREYHSHLYHDLTDHTPQSDEYFDRKVVDIHHIDMEVTIWEQFRQEGANIQAAIKVAKENLPCHAVTRSLLSDEVFVPDVKIAAYMYDDDPDAFIDAQYEKRDGIENPYEGVIKYYDLDYKDDMSKEIAARTELLFTDISSEVVLRFMI